MAEKREKHIFNALESRNMIKNGGQKPMSWIAFKIMTIIMSIRKKFRNIEEEVCSCGIKAGDYVLDFGCGIGFNTIPAAQKAGDSGKVFALDINPQAIKIINKKIAQFNLKNVELILSDRKSNLPDESIDIVYLHNTLPLLKDKKGVLNEIFRILKIRGKLSYMSRKIARLAGNRSSDGILVTDTELKQYLDPTYKCIKEKKGHLIFEKLAK